MIRSLIGTTSTRRCCRVPREIPADFSASYPAQKSRAEVRAEIVRLNAEDKCGKRWRWHSSTKLVSESSFRRWLYEEQKKRPERIVVRAAHSNGSYFFGVPAIPPKVLTASWTMLRCVSIASSIGPVLLSDELDLLSDEPPFELLPELCENKPILGLLVLTT
jgi:hypothetical protein